MIINKLINCFLWFILFSLIGWVVETLIYAIRDKEAVKRGFLFGPLCPIYGFGVVISYLVLGGKVSRLLAVLGQEKLGEHGIVIELAGLFILGIILCDTLEYVTSFVLEKAFHSRWWDYTGRFLSIKGRICFRSSMYFGVGVAAIVKFIMPVIEDMTNDIEFNCRLVAAFIIYTVLIVDVVLTVQNLKDVIESLKLIEQYALEGFQEGINKSDEAVNDLVDSVKHLPETAGEKLEHFGDKVKNYSGIDELIDKLSGNKSILHRAKSIFPKMQLKDYKEALELIFNRTNKK